MSSRPYWIKEIPASQMIFPDRLSEQLKYIFWRFYTPFHPYFRDLLLSLGIAHHSGRQNYLIGKIAPGQSVRDFVSYLVKLGYGNHFIAWIDQGEVAGLRYVKDFRHQYHIRVFEDGEIRAHYEYTPECYPLLHLKAINQIDCRDEIIRTVGDKIVAV